ncbi:MAG: hypothetical protein RI933_1137 [Actinomycetota bacterium]
MTENNKKPAALKVLSGLIFLEGLVVLGLAVILLIQVVTGEITSFIAAITLLALVSAAAAWVITIAINLLSGMRWSRSGAVFWQFVQLAVAMGSFGGQFGSQAIGWAIFAPSAIGLYLLFRGDVVAATQSSKS